MSDDTSARLGLPLLQAGQAQKEATHNEALALLDLAVQPAVESVGLDTPPAAPAEGQCWIVGSAPTGAWTGQAGALAGWTGGGWRYVAAHGGMTAWSLADAGLARFEGSAWSVGARQAAIAAPSDGTVIDTQARAALTQVLVTLRAHGLIAS